jgi:hypothetical protein
MIKSIVLAATAAVLLGTTGLASSADAHGYGYKSRGYGHSYGYKYRSYKPHYGYRYYKPVYTYRYYKPVCSHYGWSYKHGYKAWTCLW